MIDMKLLETAYSCNVMHSATVYSIFNLVEEFLEFRERKKVGVTFESR